MNWFMLACSLCVEIREGTKESHDLSCSLDGDSSSVDRMVGDSMVIGKSAFRLQRGVRPLIDQRKPSWVFDRCRSSCCLLVRNESEKWLFQTSQMVVLNTAR